MMDPSGSYNSETISNQKDEFNFQVKSYSVNWAEINNQLDLMAQDIRDNYPVDASDLLKINHYFVQSMKDKQSYLQEMIKIIKYSWSVNINDFEIQTNKKNIFGLLEFLLKKIIWKLLKFYTYRLFSQQNQFNEEISQAVVALKKHYYYKIDKLEAQILELKQSHNVN